MSKLSIATRLADEIGVSISKARRFVDDVGSDAATRSLDELASGADDGLTATQKAALTGGGVVTAGGLLYRQQSIWSDQAISDKEAADAEQAETYSDALQVLLESDLPADQRRQLITDLNERRNKDAENDKSEEKANDSGLLGSEVQMTLVLLIVVAFALKFTLGSDD